MLLCVVMMTMIPPTVELHNDLYTLANNQSYGFFKDITTDNWNRLREISSKNVKHLANDDPLIYNDVRGQHKADENSRTPTAWFQSHYEPDFGCMFKKRVGGNGNGDGPKWICDPHRLIEVSQERKKRDPLTPGCIIYSVGSCGDFSFEEGLQNLLGKDTCEIHIFDMGDYGAGMPKNMNMHYHKWGIARETLVDTKGLVFKSFKQTLKDLGHLHLPAIDIFKIDCEGCEYNTHVDWIDDSTPMLQQILIEVHGFVKNAGSGATSKFFDSMKDAGYVTFSKEHNTQVRDLSAYEYSFLKLSHDFFGSVEK